MSIQQGVTSPDQSLTAVEMGAFFHCARRRAMGLSGGSVGCLGMPYRSVHLTRVRVTRIVEDGNGMWGGGRDPHCTTKHHRCCGCSAMPIGR